MERGRERERGEGRRGRRVKEGERETETEEKKDFKKKHVQNCLVLQLHLLHALGPTGIHLTQF
jgi:hypothetical protein